MKPSVCSQLVRCRQNPVSEFGPRESHDFYASVRCGALHEARTKNGWTILAKSKSGQIIDANLKVVYRDDFQSALEAFARWYKRELSVKRDFQEGFIRKFDGGPLPSLFPARCHRPARKGLSSSSC
jgi:hypothetical protein